MATVEFASIEQIKQMRKTLEDCSGYFVLIDDKIIDSFNKFIIWDDENNMLHTIEANSEMDSQHYAPFKVKSFTYDWIESITGLFNGEQKTIYQKGGLIS